MTEEMLRLLAAQRREKENLLLCIDRAWKDCARQARQARRRLRRLEGVLALTTQEIKLQPDAAAPASEDKSDETQLESLNRRLAAAQQELRQYETRLFACDRTILALKKENAELSALCDKARAQGFIPEEEEEPEKIVQISDDKFRIAGDAELEDIEEMLAMELPTDDYDTFNGFVCGITGRIPEDGETFTCEDRGLHIEVTKVEGHRVAMAIVTKCAVPDEDEE